MELADLQHHVPPSHGRTTSIVKLSPEEQEGVGIKPPKEGAGYELAVPVAKQCCKWPGDACEQHGADEGPGHGSGEGKVVVAGGQLLVDAREGSAIDQDIVCCLDVEGFLNLGVGCYPEVDEYHQWDEAQREDSVVKMACGFMVSIWSFFSFLFFYLTLSLSLSTGNIIVHLHLRESAMFCLYDFQHQMEVCCAKI